MMKSEQVKRLFSPQPTAVVGASDRSMWALSVKRNLEADGHAAFAVNAKGGTFDGAPSHVDLASIPADVGLSFVVTNNAEEALAASAAAGIASLVVIGAGFAEAGEAGQRRQQELITAARAASQIILGPNNMGFVNFAENFAAFAQPVPPVRRGGVGFASQSGGFAAAALDYAHAKDVGLSHVITLGNEAMVDVVDCIDYFIDHPACRVIALFIETIRNPRDFMVAARRAFEAGKPIVACRIGGSESGSRAAAAHTGGLATDDRIIDAAFRQCGVVRVPSVEDMLLTAAVLDEYGILPGSRVGALSPSGAVGGIIGDLSDLHAISLPAFGAEAQRRLREEVLPEFAAIGNPLDFTAYVMVKPDLMPQSAGVLRDDPELEVVIFACVTCAPQTEAAAPMLGRLISSVVDQFRDSSKPLILMDFVDAGRTPYARSYRVERGLPYILPSIEKGIPALGRAMWWSERYRGGLGGRASGAAGRLEVAGASGNWSEAQARALLASAGVPVVPAVVARSGTEAVAAAQRFGEPVALKLVSPDVAHKSDIGGVRLNVSGDDAVRAAWEAVSAAGASVAGARVDGVLVSPMRRDGVELLVGVVRDPQWGLVLAVGLGGIWVEIMEDSALRILPVDRREIRSMLGELKGKGLLEGARGRMPADMDKLVDTIAAIGDLAVRLGDRIDAIEVNPLLVHGDRIEALDALVTWNEAADQQTENTGKDLP